MVTEIVLFLAHYRHNSDTDDMTDINILQASFEKIYQGTNGPVMLYVTEQINDDNWPIIQDYCNKFSKCACYYGMEPKGSTFMNQYQNKMVPMLAFYNHKKHKLCQKLDQKAVILLRRLQNTEKMVFLACDAKAALKNFVDLGRPASKTLNGDPYVPIAAVAVDMFPHTNHCELVLCFQRIDPAEFAKNETLNKE
ncbi:hypothetical protein LSTR_LSTR006273 [Laodelphax striatellus]|uniref:Uncharacterized protein n=1 Tax=Laodelphax striatellus TaxID=195883 RepID=A0A482WQB7_LAOST|nr:hypothetical protein LSTR_LSTR006273 [Laodelphax striatellus]